ncbi:hypothetical protein GCM10027342_19280 [Photobacterium alginatilyticum]
MVVSTQNSVASNGMTLSPIFTLNVQSYKPTINNLNQTRDVKVCEKAMQLVYPLMSHVFFFTF